MRQIDQAIDTRGGWPIPQKRKMEGLIIQYPVSILLVWTLLNFLHYYLTFLNIRLYKNVLDFDSKFEVKYNKKDFFRLLLWLGFGVGMLAVFRQAMLQKIVTTNKYFVWIGAFFSLVIGWLLSDFLSLAKYFVYRRETPKLTYSSSKASMIVYSFEFFGYSALMLLSFFISKHPLLLGGTIGLAFGGILYLFKLSKRQYYSKIEQNQKK